ncbi:MAG: MBL fold metallo-hydrolase [Cyclobacteriaceae bacterium]
MKFLLKILVLIVAIFIITAICGYLFIKLSPQFGATIDGQALVRIEHSENYDHGEFQNLLPTGVGNLSLRDYSKLMYDLLVKGSEGTPTSPLPVRFGEGDLQDIDSLAYITWFGHSAVLLEMEGKSILIDPMLGPASAPVSFTTKRFAYQNPININDIEEIDAVIFSHDHYDHLDYPTVMKIKDRVGHFYTPLGLGEHLKQWGVPETNITELDWWGTVNFGDIGLTAAPARHFSGRGITDRNKTQWASWIITGKHNNLYFSGDGGYADHFLEIGLRHGPFDFAMVECGQYNPLWSQIHMTPEETVQASIDLKAKKMMPIHWGAFKLAPHAWKDPILRVEKEAELKSVKITTPVIGERFSVNEDLNEKWWNEVE